MKFHGCVKEEQLKKSGKFTQAELLFVGMFTQLCGAKSVEYIAGGGDQMCCSNYYLQFTTLGLEKCAAMTSFQDC